MSVKALCTIALVFSFITLSANANHKVMTDLGLISVSSVVMNFLELNELKIKEVKHIGTIHCSVSLSEYQISAINSDGKECRLEVTVGDCSNENESKVAIVRTEALGASCSN